MAKRQGAAKYKGSGLKRKHAVSKSKPKRASSKTRRPASKKVTKKRDIKAATKQKSVTKASPKVGSNALDQLKAMTTVVIDTGDFHLIQKYKPTDATTNPSLILAVCQMKDYEDVVNSVIVNAAKGFKGSQAELVEEIWESLAVTFGSKIVNIVPGYVSTEVDARLSFDTEATIKKAKKIIGMYKKLGVSKDRILIKIASSWEGIQAAKKLEKEGIHCNLTLLFNFHQALACAQAGATLISPFVGRILDWFKKSTGKEYEPIEEPGVQSVTRIYNYYKTHGHKTFVMGASFRNKGEILCLSGCDRLTIAPKLLEELTETKEANLKRYLDPKTAKAGCHDPKVTVTEKIFRWEMNQDAMATEKLSEGIRNFSKDLESLETIIRQKLSELVKSNKGKSSKSKKK